MNSRREFELAFVGLKPGIHEFDYKITDRFFEAYQQQDFTNCDAEVKLFLEKNLGFMLLRFEVTGNVNVFCDRCGNPLPLDLWDEFQVIVKLVDDPEIDEPGRRRSGCILYIQNGKSSSPGRLDL